MNSLSVILRASVLFPFQSKCIIIVHFWLPRAPLFKLMRTVLFGLSLCRLMRYYCSKSMNEFFWRLETRMWNALFINRTQELIWWPRKSFCWKMPLSLLVLSEIANTSNVLDVCITAKDAREHSRNPECQIS